MNTFIFQLKREYWEHKTKMLWVPLMPLMVCSLILLVVWVWSGFDSNNISLGDIAYKAERINDLPPDFRLYSLGALTGLFSVFGLIMFICQLSYFYQCCHGEVKDKSVLFWRSLPVSDHSAILAKFTTGIIVIPLAFWVGAIALIAGALVLLFVYSIVISLFADASIWPIWGHLGLFTAIKDLLLVLLALSVSVSPLFGLVFLQSSLRESRFSAILLIPVCYLVVEQFMSGIGVLDQAYGLHALKACFSGMNGIWEPGTDEVILNSAGTATIFSQSFSPAGVFLTLCCIFTAWICRRYLQH